MSEVLIERLREKDRKWQENCDRWIKAANGQVTAEQEATLRYTLEAETADHIQSLQAKLDEKDVVIGWLLDLIDELYRKYGVELDEADTLVARNARTNWLTPENSR